MLVIVAHITAVSGKAALVQAELKKLTQPTRKEKGCLQYDLHQDHNTEGTFLFYERWESRELWQAHMETPHIKDYVAATEGALADFQVYEMSHIA